MRKQRILLHVEKKLTRKGVMFWELTYAFSFTTDTCELCSIFEVTGVFKVIDVNLKLDGILPFSMVCIRFEATLQEFGNHEHG